MHKTGVPLALSLLLNVALVAVLLWPREPASKVLQQQHHTVGAPQIDAEAEGPQEPGFASAGTPDAAVPAAKRTAWLDPLTAFVSELRGRGVDEKLVRKLAKAEAERLFREQSAAVLRSRQPPAYWEPLYDPLGRSAVTPAALKEFQRLRREAVANLRALVGDAAPLEPKNPYEAFSLVAELPSFDYLPADKRLELIEYLERANLEMFDEQRQTGLRTDGAKQALQREEGVKTILGSALFEEYLKRSSPSAQSLRHELSLFRPTQAEFDALVRIEWETSNERLLIDGQPQEQAKHQALDARRLDAIRSALGHSRFEEFERDTDFAYRHLERLASARLLGSDAARSAFVHVQQARARVARISNGRDMRDAQLRAEIGDITQDLRRKLIADLGLSDLTEEQLAQALGPATQVWQTERYTSIRRWRRF